MQTDSGETANQEKSKALARLLSNRRIDPSMDIDFETNTMFLGSAFDFSNLELKRKDAPSKWGDTGIHWSTMVATSDRDVFTLDGALAASHFDNWLERPTRRVRLDGLFGTEERISGNALMALLIGNEPSTNLAVRLTDKLRKYVALPEPWHYEFLVVWIAGTYLFKVFPHYPIVVLMSDQPGSGKSTLLSVVERLSFNAQRFNGFTESALIRTANDAACTILLDEAEVLGRPQVSEGKLIELLNSRYEADALYRMSVETRYGWETHAFRLYGPTLIAKLRAGGVPPTIQSRAEEINMKPLAGDNRHLQNDHPRYDDDWLPLRDELFLWALLSWRDIYQTYRFDPEVRVGINRRMDVWRVMLSIAKVLSRESYEALRASAQAVPKERDEVAVLRSYVDECRANRVTNAKLGDVARELGDSLPQPMRRGGKALKKALMDLGVNVRPGTGGYNWVWF